MVNTRCGWHSGKIICSGINCLSQNISAGAGEKHGIDASITGTVGSSGNVVGANIILTTAGSAGAWASAIYAKVVQGTTKNINGYLTAAEFEVVNSNTNVSDWFVLGLNANSTTRGSHSSFIAIRDYGSTSCNSLLWFGPEITAGSDGDTTALVAAASGVGTADYTIRILFHDTPLWIPCSTSQT